MFRPYDPPPSRPPFKPEYPAPLPYLMQAAALPADVLPLPSNWDQLELDQRVRSIGEW